MCNAVYGVYTQSMAEDVGIRSSNDLRRGPVRLREEDEESIGCAKCLVKASKSSMRTERFHRAPKGQYVRIVGGRTIRPKTTSRASGLIAVHRTARRSGSVYLIQGKFGVQHQRFTRLGTGRRKATASAQFDKTFVTFQDLS